MIDRSHKLSVSRQARLLNISRGTVYYRAKPTSDSDLSLMKEVARVCLVIVAQGQGLDGLMKNAPHYSLDEKPRSQGSGANCRNIVTTIRAAALRHPFIIGA